MATDRVVGPKPGQCDINLVHRTEGGMRSEKEKKEPRWDMGEEGSLVYALTLTLIPLSDPHATLTPTLIPTLTPALARSRCFPLSTPVSITTSIDTIATNPNTPSLMTYFSPSLSPLHPD
jgi:hypothetical protein